MGVCPAGLVPSDDRTYCTKIVVSYKINTPSPPVPVYIPTPTPSVPAYVPQ